MLRFCRLGHEPLWFDEAYAALMALRPLGELGSALHGDEGNAPLYFLLLHAWVGCFGDGEFALRALSALAGAATVPAVYLVGARLFTRRAGLFAASLALVSPLHVHYSQEARMYALVPPLVLAALYGLHSLLTKPGAFGVILFAAAATTGLYLHYYFFFLLPLAGLAILAPRRHRAIARVALALVLVTVGFLPWWPMFAQQSASGAQDWVAEYWRHRPLWYAPLWSLESLGPGALYPSMANLKFPSSVPARVVSLLLATTVLGCGIAAARGSRTGNTAAGEAAEQEVPAWIAWVLMLAATLVPLLLASAVSLAWRPVYVVARHDMIAWAPYHVLAGAVLAWLGSWPRRTVPAVWLWLALSTLLPYYGTDRPRRSYAAHGDLVARTLRERGDRDDLVVLTAGTRTTVEYYLRSERDRFHLASFPMANDAHLGWIDVRVYSEARFALDASSEFLAWLLRSPLPTTIWLIAPGSRGTAPLLGMLEAAGYARDVTDRSSLLPLMLCLRRR